MSSLSFFGEILSLKKNLTHQMSMPPNSFSTNSFKRHEYFISKLFLKRRKSILSYTWGNLDLTAAQEAVIYFGIQMCNF